MSQPEPNEITVEHNRTAQCFEATINGHRAVAEYSIEEGRVAFTHTYVPVELRGKGIAEKLVRPALAWARSEKLRVVPRCSYVAAFIDRHAEFRDLLS